MNYHNIYPRTGIRTQDLYGAVLATTHFTTQFDDPKLARLNRFATTHPTICKDRIRQACKTLRACNPPYNHNVSRMAAKIVNMADPKANKSCPAYCDNKRKYISIDAVFITRVTKIVSLPFSLYIRLTIFIHHISLHSICYIKGNPILKRK